MLRIFLIVMFLAACSSDVRLDRQYGVDSIEHEVHLYPLHTLAGTYINESKQEELAQEELAQGELAQEELAQEELAQEELAVRRIDVGVIGGELYANVEGDQGWQLDLLDGQLYASDNSPFGTEGVLIEATPELDRVGATTTLWFFGKPYNRVPTKGRCAGPGHFAPTSSYAQQEIQGWTVMLACDH